MELSTMSIQALRERRGTIAAALQELVAKPDFTVDDQATYDNSMADIDKIDASIKRIQDANAKLAADAATASVAEGADRAARNTGSKGMSVFAKWLRGGDAALNADDWASIRNTMSTTTGSQGGFSVDSQVATSVIDRLRDFGGMRQVSTVISTSGFGSMSFPTSDGTTEEGEIVAENATVGRLSVSFGTVGLPAFKFSSLDVAVPIELIQDSNVDIEGFVQARLVTRLGRITNRLFTTGTGTGQPNGIATAATIGVTAANGTSQVTAVTYDSLVDLQHSVDPAYRAMGRWMFNDTTLRQIRKIRDGSQRPIFVPGYEADNPGGSPDRLLGAPIVINQDVANMAASARSILFGDFSGYYVRDVMAMEMYRFTDSAFARNGQVGFLAMMRSGGNLVDVNKVRIFVNAAT
jgi:HK97 family phage major capsid protein